MHAGGWVGSEFVQKLGGALWDLICCLAEEKPNIRLHAWSHSRETKRPGIKKNSLDYYHQHHHYDRYDRYDHYSDVVTSTRISMDTRSTT